MFKVKLTKKSSTNIMSTNGLPADEAVSSKRVQLNQNNDIINHQEKKSNLRDSNQNRQINSNPPNLLRSETLRPRSSINKNQNKPSNQVVMIGQNNDEQKLLQTVKLKNLGKPPKNMGTQRPSTSTNLKQSGGRVGQLIKQKLLNRKKQKNKSSVPLKASSMQDLDQDQHESSYITNEQAEVIILGILEGNDEYLRLKSTNQDQFEKLKQKLLSNTSIIVLKWYKILQDQLYNEVKRLRNSSSDQNSKQSANNHPQNLQVPSSFQQVVSQQINRFFSKQKGLFTIEERCASRQNRLQKLIDGRLQRLQNLLISSGKAC